MKLALSSLPRSAPRRSGFTLLEVALAMAIFLIGALAIIRIFPGGLAVVEQSENSLRASDINKATLARLNEGGGTPRSIFYGDIANPVAPTWTNFNGAVLGPTRPNNSLPVSSQLADLYNSALINLSTIQGESSPIRIDSKGTIATTDDTAYVLTQFPIAFNRDQLNGATTTNTVNIFEEDELENVQISVAGKLDLKTATFKKSGVRFYDAAVSTDADSVCSTNANTCILYSSYRYKDPTLAGYSAVTEEPVAWKGTLDTANNEPVTRFPATNASAVPVAGSVRVRFRHLLGVETIPSTALDLARTHLGYVPLVPTTPYTILTASSLSELGSVTLDYLAGWSSYSLVQDIPSLTPQAQYSDAADPTNPTAANAIPAQGEAQIALSSPFTFARGTLPLCALTINNDVQNRSVLKMVLYNGANKLGDTSELLLKSNTEIEALPENQKEIAYKEQRYALRSGRVSFNMKNAALVDEPAKQARVAYATRDNWIQQLSVASSSYTRFSGVPTASPDPTSTYFEPWRDYTIGTDNYLYFQPTEAGKTVQVTYTYLEGSVPRTETSVAIIEQRLVLPPTTISADFGKVTTGGIRGRVARLRLYKQTNPDGSPVTNLQAVQDVRGLSVSMRTAWLERDRWTQNINTTIRGVSP